MPLQCIHSLPLQHQIFHINYFHGWETEIWQCAVFAAISDFNSTLITLFASGKPSTDTSIFQSYAAITCTRFSTDFVSFHFRSKPLQIWDKKGMFIQIYFMLALLCIFLTAIFFSFSVVLCWKKTFPEVLNWGSFWKIRTRIWGPKAVHRPIFLLNILLVY